MKRGLILHHTSVRTPDILVNEGMQMVTHPANSPDLSPCDFFLFVKLKLKLKERRFINDTETLAPFQDAIDDIDKKTWKSCFEDWFWRMKFCMDNNGDFLKECNNFSF